MRFSAQILRLMLYILSFTMRSTFTVFTHQKRKPSKLGILEIHVLPLGGTLIFLYIRRLGSFLGVRHFEFQYFGGLFFKK